MSLKSDEEKEISKKIKKWERIEEEYLATSGEIVKTLKKLKNVEKEYLDLVEAHQRYWKSELEKTEYKNTERRRKLKEVLKKEGKICETLKKELKRTDERIEFHKKHG